MRKSWFYTAVVVAVTGLAAWGGSLAVVFGAKDTTSNSDAFRKVSESYNKIEVDTRLARVVAGDTTLDLSRYATKETTYTKAEVDAKINSPVTASYTKAESDSKYARSSIIPTLVTNEAANTRFRTIADSYSKTEIDTKIAAIPTTGGGTTIGSSNADAFLQFPNDGTLRSGYLLINPALNTRQTESPLVNIPSDALTSKALVERLIQNVVTPNLKDSTLAYNLGINNQVEEILTININFNNAADSDTNLHLGGVNLGLTHNKVDYTDRTAPGGTGDWFRATSRENSFLWNYDIVGVTIQNKENPKLFVSIPVNSRGKNWNTLYCRQAGTDTPEVKTFDNTNALIGDASLSGAGGFFLKTHCERGNEDDGTITKNLRLYFESQTAANNNVAYLSAYSMKLQVVAKK